MVFISADTGRVGEVERVGRPYPLPFRVVELAGPGHLLTEGHEQPALVVDWLSSSQSPRMVPTQGVFMSVFYGILKNCR